MGLIGREIKEYTLAMPWDVSTASYAGDAESLSISSQESTPTSLAFSSDGTKIFVIGYNGDNINEYALTIAWDVSTASYAGDTERFSVAAQESTPVSLAFSSEGTKMFVMGNDVQDINEYTLTTAWDVSTASYAGDGERFSVAAQESEARSLAFIGDGTKMFVVGVAGDDINEYNLTTSWDVSTATYAGNVERLSVLSQPVSLAFSADGTQMYVMNINSRNINQYSLAAPVITQAVANQAINDNETISLFAAITVADPNGDNVSATITLDDNAKGALTGTGLAGTGPYTLTSTDAASLQASLHALVFNPADNRVAFGNTETTTFTLAISDGSFSDTDSRTTVVASPIAPTIVWSSLASSPTNVFTITATFSEPVTGFTIGDLTVGNGTASDFVAISTSVYTATITPAADGTVTVDAAAGVAQDPGGVDNIAASQFSITADVAVPAITISSPVADPTNVAFTATFTFSEEVAGFDVADITVGNGTAESFTFTNASVYTAEITPTTDGTVTVDVAANVAQDAATNGNTAATQFSLEADFIAPTVTITSPAADPTNGAFAATFTFSEDVTGFDVADLNVGNGTAGSFAATGASVYTAEITPSADGTVTIDVRANVAQDAATNGNTAAAHFSVAADLTAPTLTITSPIANPTNGAFTATFTFSEDVTGFDVADINVGNGTAGSFAATSASVYTAEITPTTDGTVTVDVAANIAQDAATNGNTVATQFSVEADFTAPTITVTSLVANPAMGAFTATFTFSEDVTGFELMDITVSNGTAGNFAVISSSVYTAEITPTADGTITIDVAANAAEDAAINGNQAAARFSMLFDGTNPTVTITSSLSVSTKVNPIPVTITFNEEVTDFTVSDIAIGNGSVANFSTSDNIVFTANIIPVTDGDITVDIAYATAQDLAGNSNTAATTFSIAYDSQIDQIICQNITVELDANGTAPLQVDQIDNGSLDSFGIASRSINITSFNCSDVGDNNVTLTITDNNGNLGTCEAVVTVEDAMVPTVLTQDITVALDVNGQASVTPADIDNGSTDNCGIATLVLDVSSFDIPTTESTTVTLTVTDVNGNSAAATAIVTFSKVAQSIVFDPIADKKVGQDPVVLEATGGGSGLPVTFSIVTEPSSGVASLVNGAIIIEGTGSIVVTASQAGNDIFQAAEEVSQSFAILSSELFLPTLFTPNNDQANDRFILRGGGSVANIELQIFDREGNPVFNSQSTTELFQSGWDGTNEGKEQPQGAYVWVIKGTFQDGSTLLINGKDTGIIRLAR
ncbi:Ig-like domain-containing protein [Imperialibacter roseus]|uniref:Ig-like domain-containing protein n=1 Tax=Imperialibacter roseus TaxID=1324217 RepID=A0ABZ0IIP9_9BACT|nr:Ig-like domain-containing protein [Imperialibacter roseus]WOK04905.1 Ig-like domain-containing protein [Imperialibacter roseus]